MGFLIPQVPRICQRCFQRGRSVCPEGVESLLELYQNVASLDWNVGQQVMALPVLEI